jgi:hypothetical protein
MFELQIKSFLNFASLQYDKHIDKNLRIIYFKKIFKLACILTVLLVTTDEIILSSPIS